MSHNNGLPASSATLHVIIIVLLLVPGAWPANKYISLYTFSGGLDGRSPSSGLTFGTDGSLYGVTEFGGLDNLGTVFRLTPDSDGSWTESVLYSFSGTDGENPVGNLVFDSAGNLYGTTGYGAGDVGTVFRLTPKSDGSWTESTLYAFCSLRKCADGLNPFAGLIFDRSGNLYGTTLHGGKYGLGTIFELSPSADGRWTESVLHSFGGGNDGANPFSGLIFDTVGNLYGTTFQGGSAACRCGTLFELTPGADGKWKENVLHRFNDKDGAFPVAELIFDTAGNLYGTTEYGGNHGCLDANDCGIVFSLIPTFGGNWTEKVLHRFSSGEGGSNPAGGLTFDSAGNLYGTTFYRGKYVCEGYGGCGVVFKLTPKSEGGWSEGVLHTFHDRPGANPAGGVVFDTAGNLYGTTVGDYFTTFGSAFEITP